MLSDFSEEVMVTQQNAETDRVQIHWSYIVAGFFYVLKRGKKRNIF